VTGKLEAPKREEEAVLEIVPESNCLDEYSALAHRAVRAAEQMYPGSRACAATGDLNCVPVLVERSDGEIAVIRYRREPVTG